MLEQFIAECKKVDSRVKFYVDAYGKKSVAINNDYVCVDGYNLPYQMKLITDLMSRNGSFC